MRIGFVVGRLELGGAELQMMRLCAALARRGHTVEVMTYAGASPLDEALRSDDVVVRNATGGSRWSKLRTVRAWLRAFDPDVVHGVMKRASSVAVLARWPRGRPAVVATDMSTATYGRRKPVFWMAVLVFRWADRVVTQSELNRRNLVRWAPWLAAKTRVVRNGLDLARFGPADAAPVVAGRRFRFCVVGTVYGLKNPDGVVRAVAALRARGRDDVEVDWYGRSDAERGFGGSAVHPAVDLARALGVADVVRFHPAVADIERVYRGADALLHASIQEGFPNAVAEAMASGLPIVVSDVSDLPQVVSEARNGFVFEAADDASMSDAIVRMVDTSPEERLAMGRRSRDLAERWFALERFVDEFEALFLDAAGERR